MYSQDRIDKALQVYHQCGCATETIRVLGYPTRRALYTWIENEGMPKSPRKEAIHVNTAVHPRQGKKRVDKWGGGCYDKKQLTGKGRVLDVGRVCRGFR